MTNRSRYRSALVLGGVVALALSACAPGGAPPSDEAAGQSDEPSEVGGKITVGMEAGSPHETFYAEKASEFTAETGIEVEILGVPHENMHQQFLNDAISGAGAYDVLMVDQPWVAEFAENGYLLSLDDRIDDAFRADFIEHTLDTVTVDGAIYGLPFLVHNLVMYYRPSMVEAVGLSGPPSTWAEYEQAAADMTDADAGVYGTMIPGNKDGEVATRFLSYMMQSGGELTDAQMQPTFDTPAALESFEMMLAIQGAGSSPAGLHDLSAIQGQFLEGKIGMVAQWPYMWAMAVDPAQSKIADDVAVALNPGNPDQAAMTFSWGFGINAATKNADAAWKWIEWATSSEILTQKAIEQLSPVPRISSSEALASAPELSDRDKDALAIFAESLARSSTMPMTPLFPQFQSIVAEAVSAVMSGQAEPAAAVAAAQAQMEELSGE